jgi:uncharacterized protein (TIGR03437 family)
MRQVSRFFIFQSFTIALMSAQVFNPTILNNGIVNVASYAYPGLPGADIAQGSMVVVFGTNFGPASLVQAGSFPLPTSLSGTSVKVTSGGVTKDAVMIYTAASQLAAIIPSSLPALPKATMTVSYNGKTSLPATFNMVTAATGIFASNSAGVGPGIITDANSAVYTTNNSAHGGDIAVIWGTGLGAVAGDEAAGPLPGNFPGSPVQVYVGGQLAKVGYKGRSGCCSGIDQVVFTIPAGVAGCRVPVFIQNDHAISNFTSVPIAASETSTCSEPGGPAESDVRKFSNAGASLGYITLSRTDTTTSFQDSIGGTLVGSTTTRDESITATFYKYSAAQMNTAINPFSNGVIGACSVYNFTGGNNIGIFDPAPPVSLDAGSSLSIVGSGAAKKATVLKTVGPAHYFGDLFVALPPAAGYLEAGSFTITGTGGASIGAFTARTAVQTPLTWTNMNKDATFNITRESGQTVTWTGGDQAGTVTISGQSSNLGSAAAVGAAFICTANASDGQFTIPGAVLQSLPVTGTAAGQQLGSLSVGTTTPPAPFTAPGLDLGYSVSVVTAKRPVKYK